MNTLQPTGTHPYTGLLGIDDSDNVDMAQGGS
jgi:hypothetical protein